MMSYIDKHFAKKPDLILELFDQKGTESLMKQNAATTDNVETTQVNMHVSSKHLTEASPYFETLLNGNFSEGATSGASLRRIPLKGVQPTAFALLMDILHHRTKSLASPSIDSEVFYQVCILIDMYTLHEQAMLYTDKWFDLLRAEIPDRASENLNCWIFIAYVLGKADTFESLTCVLQRSLTTTAYVSKTPLPSYIEESLQSRRDQALTQCMKSLQDLLALYENSLNTPQLRCEKSKEDCDALVLGALIRSLNRAWLYPPSDAILISRNISFVLTSLDRLKIPSLCGRREDNVPKEPHRSYNSGYNFVVVHDQKPKISCGVGANIESIASILRSNSKGISLPKDAAPEIQENST